MRYQYDAVIVGSGIAGLTAAIYLKKSGKDVAVLTKSQSLQESNTWYAQGGIVASCQDDKPELLADDILHAGVHFNNRDSVDFFSQEGPSLVFDFLINQAGVEFSRNSDGSIDYTEEAAHSIRRIVHYKDHTGDKIEEGLVRYARECGVTLLTGMTAVDLITNNHHSRDHQELYRPREVMGLYALENESGEVHAFFSGAVILATGGVGNLYQHTTNPEIATGDGISMAYRAGADIINSEFVQFHPTSLFHRDIKRFLISEALRGEGARLVDHKGHRFMSEYSDMEELAPRDVVSRAIYDRMRRTGSEFMFLDLANHYKGSHSIADRFSKIYSTLKPVGIDISAEPIPIVPAAHYFCGGIKVDCSGQSSISGLYAIGEVSCSGLHGANRLASTSLLEGVLWGKSCAERVAGLGVVHPVARLNSIPDWEFPSWTEEFDPLLLEQDMKAIQLTMWNYAGIIRTRKGLERAKSDLNYYFHRIIRFYQEAELNQSIIELRNAVVCSQIIVDAALRNGRSIGCHHLRN